MELRDRVAIVTGGSGGLGGRICRALASSGSVVIPTYNTAKEKGETVSRGLVSEFGIESLPLQCDVTDPDQVYSLVSKVLDRFGRIDILINDAGYNRWIPFQDLDSLTHAEWNKILDVNLTGPMHCTKAVSGPMKRQGNGRIVNIASVAGLGPTGSSIAYAVAKSGLIHLTKCTALALAPDVLVNCVAPGYLEGTGMSDNLAPEYRKAAKEGALLKRAADKDDIAAQVVEFCRTDSVTGQTLVIDSGRIFN